MVNNIVLSRYTTRRHDLIKEKSFNHYKKHFIIILNTQIILPHFISTKPIQKKLPISNILKNIFHIINIIMNLTTISIYTYIYTCTINTLVATSSFSNVGEIFGYFCPCFMTWSCISVAEDHCLPDLEGRRQVWIIKILSWYL